MTRRRARTWVRAGVALACAGLAAGCGSGARTGSDTGSAGSTAYDATPEAAATAPLSTSLVTAQGTWAVTVMGGSAASQNNFWQLFVRTPGASRWSLATPPGVADNGGLVAAGTGTSLLVGVRPSQALAFSPLATSTDTGRNWTPGLLDAGLASVPDALAVAPSGQALALLPDGSVRWAAGTSAATAGQWPALTTLRALDATAAGRECGLRELQAVSFGLGNDPMVAGSCEQTGVAGVFTDSGGTWASAGLALPAQYRGDRIRVLGLASGGSGGGGNVALVLAGNSLLMAWSTGTHWTVSGPVTAGPVTAGPVQASGFGTGGSAWLLLSGGRGETISGPGATWRALPAVPPRTATLAPGAGGSYDALAVAGSKLTVWRLAQGAWSRVQTLSVPIVYGSSS